MCHECEECGQWCYCDQDDTAFDHQPIDCRHLSGIPGECAVADGERDDDLEGGGFDGLMREDDDDWYMPEVIAP
jgi:hypothetical protein